MSRAPRALDGCPGVLAKRLADALDAARAIRFLVATGDGTQGIDAVWRERPVLAKPFRAGDLRAVIAGLAG